PRYHPPLHSFPTRRSSDLAHGGLGLGLSLAKSFVEAHKGTVEAESEGAGRGSRFTVRLPRLAGRVSAPAYEKKEIQAHEQPQSGRLLIIEDDADTLELMQATFEKRGFRVTTCVSAAEALGVAPRNS